MKPKTIVLVLVNGRNQLLYGVRVGQPYYVHVKGSVFKGLKKENEKNHKMQGEELRTIPNSTMNSLNNKY